MAFKRHDYSSTIAKLNKMAESDSDYYDDEIEKEASAQENTEPPSEDMIKLMFSDYYRESTNERIVKQKIGAKQEIARQNSETATDTKGNSCGFRRTN